MPKKKSTPKVTPTMPENEQLKPDLTAENFHEHPDTPADQLSSFVENYRLGNRADDAEDKIGPVSKHPNLPTASISDLYAHKMGPDSAHDEGKYTLDRDNDHVIGNLLSHPNSAPSIAEDFLSRTHKTKNWTTNATHSQAASHPGISHEFLKDIALKTIDADAAQDEKFKGYKLPADFHEELLANRGDFEPEGMARLNEEQQAKNTRIKNIDQVIYGSYPNAIHTPESLKRATEFYTKHEPTDKSAFSQSKAAFVEKQKGLSSNDLEAILNSKDKSDRHYGSDDDMIGSVFNHPNISPELISKEALKVDDTGNHWNHDKAKSAAISSERLPEETRRKLIRDLKPADIESYNGDSKYIASQLLENEKLPAEDVEAIYNKGGKSAMFHPNAPEKLVRDYYEKGNKSAEHVRYAMQKKDLPPDILADIVSHNKNQNVSIEALNHKNVNLSVVEAGLKRKAKLVQDAASRNPLVARQQLVERLTNGKLRGSDFVHGTQDKKISALDGLDENNAKDVYAALNSRYKDSSDSNIEALGENPRSYWGVKAHLATGEKVPPAIQQQNIKAVADKFGKLGPDYWDNRENKYNDPVHSTAVKLANQGDEYTQNKWLAQPEHLNDLDLSSESYGTDFLNKATQAIQDQVDRTPRDRDGSYKIERMNNAAKDMIYNPNISDDLFHRLAMRPDFVESQKNIEHPDKKGGSNWGKKMETDFNTVFDTKWGHLPENEMRENFQNLANMNTPGAHNAVVNSMKAPTDIWLNSYNKMNSEAQNYFLRDHSIADFGDRNLHDMAMYGKLGGNSNSEIPQLDILKSLDPTSDEDITRLNNFMSTPQEDTQSRANPENIISKINPAFWQGPDGEGLIENALDKGVDQEGVDAALVKASSMDGDKALAYLQSIANRPDREGRPDNATGRWYSILHSDSGASDREDRGNNSRHAIKVLSSIARDGNVVNGKLDFLMNMPGDENMSKFIRAKAIEMNLISPAAQATAIANNPDVLKAALDKASDVDKRRMVRDMLTGANVLKGDSLAALADKTDIASLNSYATGYYRSAHSRGQEDRTKQQADANNFITKFFDHATRLPGDSGPQLAAKFLYNATADDEKVSPRYGALTKDARKQMVSHFLKTVEAAPIDDNLKNKYLLQAYNQFAFNGDGDSKMLPGTLLANISKRAIKTDDVATLTGMVDNGFASPAVTDRLSKLANDPSKLSDTNLHSMINLLNNNKISDSACNNIIKAAQGRISLLATKDPASEESKTMKIAFVRNMMRAADNKNNEGWVDKAIKYSNDPHVGPEVHKILSHYLDSTRTNVNPRKIFDAIPADAELNNDGFSLGQPTPEMVNDPKVLEQGADGWKLRYLSEGVIAANTETANLLIGRVLDSKIMSNEEKESFTARVLHSPNASTEGVIKSFRAMSHAAQIQTIHNQSKASGTSRIHEVFPHILGTVDEHMKADPNGRDAFSQEHNEHLFNTINAMSTLILKKNQSMASEEQKGAYADAIDHMVGQCQKIFEGTVARTAQDLSTNYKSAVDNLALTSVKLSSAAESFSNSDTPLHKEQSLPVLGMIKNAFALADTADKNLPVHERGGGKRDKAVEALSAWIAKSEVGTGEWKNVFDQVPLAKYALVHRNSCDANVMSSVNWDEFFTDPKAEDFGPMEQAAELIGKLGSDAKSYARTICQVAMNVPEGRNFSHPQFCKMVLAGVQTAPEHFDAKFMKDVSDRVGVHGDWNEIKSQSMKYGAGGKKWLHECVNDNLEFADQTNEFWKSACSNPHMDSEASAKLLDISKGLMKNASDRSAIVTAFSYIHTPLAKNPKTPSAAIGEIIDDLEKHGPILKEERYNYRGNENEYTKISEYLSKNPQVDEKMFSKLHNATADQYEKMFQANKEFSPSFLNPKFGGDLFRSQPQVFPEGVPNFEADPKKVIKQCEHSVAKERLEQAMQHIPPEGIMWAQFKKIAPKMENWPEVKDAFMKKNNKPLMPEDLLNAIKSVPDKSFHVTFSRWDGIQRHTRKNPNLVMQLSMNKDMETKLQEDPKMWGFYKYLLKASGGHPITPRIASWVRVDTSAGKDGWIVEEFQTDFESNLQGQLAHIKSQPHRNIQLEDGTQLSYDEASKIGYGIANIINGWHKASINGLHELAKKQGVKYIYQHGEGIAATLRSFKEGENPVWMQELYSKTPKALGWEKIDYNDYPDKNPRLADEAKQKGRPTYCWRKKVG